MNGFLKLCVAIVLPPAALSSCETARYYAQAITGQREILHQARPIGEIEVEKSTTPKLRRQLELVVELREFARTELHLPARRQFKTYADLGRSYAVYNVYAAPEFSVEAKSWWYPFVGRAKYRGYFSKELAKEEGEKLKREGYDVFVSGVRVYSTLGWFRDPVLNTFIDEESAELADTLFHELTHARVFIGGDTDFNEAFATANAREGVRRWLRFRRDIAGLARYEHALREEDNVLRLLQRTRVRLQALYTRKDAMTVDELRREKARTLELARREYETVKHQGGAGRSRDPWFGKQFNNARLATLASYHDLVPGFTRLLREQGGDLEKFYAAVEAMKHLTEEERRERLMRGASGEKLP